MIASNYEGTGSTGQTKTKGLHLPSPGFRGRARAFFCLREVVACFNPRPGEGATEDVEQALVSINEWKDTYALTRAEHSAEAALQWERFERKNDQKFNDMQKAQYLDFKELKRDIEVAAEHSRSVDEQLKMLREMLMTIMQQKQ